jgi:TPR repeat protein
MTASWAAGLSPRAARVDPVRLLGGLVILVALTACRTDAGTSEPETRQDDPGASVAGEPEASDGSQADSSAVAPQPVACAPLEAGTVADEAYARGKSKLAEAYDGEHYSQAPFDEAMAALRLAAEQGHRAAQSIYGRTLFSVRYTNQAPVPEEEEDYVSAFTFMRIAALRGDPDVQDYVPGLTAPAPPLTEEPLSQVPAAWLTRSYARADAWMSCHAAAAGNRGAQ